MAAKFCIVNVISAPVFSKMSNKHGIAELKRKVGNSRKYVTKIDLGEKMKQSPSRVAFYICSMHYLMLTDSNAGEADICDLFLHIYHGRNGKSWIGYLVIQFQR